MNQIKFCTWKPDYPEYAVAVAAVAISSTDDSSYLHILSPIFQTAKDVRYYLDKLEGQYRRKIPQSKINLSLIYVVSLRLMKLWEMKPEYWRQVSSHMDFSDTRTKLFTDLLLNWENSKDSWRMVITPSPKTGQEISFTAGMVTPATKSDKNIEAFMLYSDWPVEPTASHAAIYSVDDVKPFLRKATPFIKKAKKSPKR